MRNRIVTAVKQRFSIRKLSIGAASVLLGTSLYFMGGSATIVHADVSGNTPQTETSKGEPASAGVDGSSDQQEEVGDNALIRASGKEPTTPANQEKNDIQDYINYKNAHPNTVSGKDIKDFADQGLSVDDEKGSEINQITVDHNNNDNGNTLPKGQSETIDGIYITHTTNMTHKEQNVMKINSNNKVIVDFQHDQCNGKEITVTYDNLNNSYYLENIDNKTNRIKISKIKRTFSNIIQADKTLFTSDGHTSKGADGVYDKCDGPQLIIYNDPYDGFFYNNIKQVSVKDIYYDDNNKAITFENGDNNKAWIFVTSLNSNGGGNVEKVKAENPNGTSADIEKIAGSTVTGSVPVDENTTKEFTRTVELFDEHSNGDYLRNYLRENADDLKNQGWIWKENSFELTQTVTLHVKKTDAGYVYDNENAFFKGLTLPSISENGTEKYPDIKIPEVGVGTKTAVRIRISYSASNSSTPKPLDKPEVGVDNEKVPDPHDGWWYSDESNSPQNNYPDWDNKSKDNRYAFVGAVAIQYQPGMTITYGADDTEWGSHWACMQTQVVSSLNQHFVNRQGTVTRTIHYLYDNGNTAQPDKTQTVSFNETGIKDDVTGKTTWSNDNAQTVDSVITPSITGYTPDQSSIEKHTFNFGDPDINVTVHYNANAQTAKITYIDDTTKTNLDSKDANGKFGQTITFTTAPTDEIASYEKKGYVLVSNSFNNNKYQADNSNNVFEVHLKHGTKKVSQEHSASFTVHYIYKDGKQAKPDHEQTLSFTENGIQDLVTQKITWTPATSQKFDDVTTPKITGYTPDQDKVAGQTADFDTGDREVTVTYLPDVQLGHINYIDDNTNKTLTRDNFSGKTNEHEDYTPIDRIQEFENKGYELVSNDYPDDGFNFDDNDQQDQVFNVHLKHGIVTVDTNYPQTPNTPIDPDPQSPKYPKDINDTNSDVKRTIDYKYSDGKTAQPTVNDSLHFERTVVIDKVTGDVLSDTWTPSQNFNDVQTPVIQGYTPNKTVVSDKNIGHDHQDIIEHVVYNPDAQHMAITYIDDTTGETLKQDKLDGTSDQDTKYTTGDNIKHYTDLHYKLVSDSTNGQDLIFDHYDKVYQTYYVHLKHGTHAIKESTSPKQTIHYVYADGLARQGQAADDNIQTLRFERNGYNDEVTGTDHWNAWTPTNSNYNAVDSPVIQGYTPDKSVIEKSTVNPTDKDIEITVTYNADKQAAHVIYVDKTTGKTLETTDLTGVSDQNSGYNTQKQIGDYRNKHYVLTSDETNGKNIVFDHNDKADQTYYVYFVHGTQDVNRQDDVTETVDYKFEDGTTAQPTVTQTKHFSEDGVKDLVTGEITWTPATPQKFDDIATKSIVGYTPDKDNVAGSTVNFCDPDINVTVYYKANAQKASVTYVDDKTGKTLKVDNLNGVTNAKSGYTTKAAIDTYTGLGYTLVSDDTNGKEVVFDNDDAVDQAFTVHLSHGTITVTPENPGKPGEPVDPDNPDGPKYPDGTDEYQVKRTGTQTIHYVGASDKTPADNKQTFVFTREITFDDVTGKIISVTPWNVQSHTFGNVDTPVIPGYHADKAVAGGATVTPDDLNKVIIVTYAPDGGSGDNPGSNGGGDQGTTPTPEPVPEPTPSPDDQPDTTLPSDNNTDKDVEKDKQDKPEEVKKVRKIIKTRITKQEHIGNAEKAEPLAEQEHNDQTVASPVKNEANEPRLPQTGEANTSVIGLLGMLVAGFAAILGFESSRSRKHKNQILITSKRSVWEKTNFQAMKRAMNFIRSHRSFCIL